MASRPPGICPECSAVAIGGRYCPKHIADNRALRASRDRETIRRASGLKRLYDGVNWRVRTRRFILARDPLCQIAVLCGGRAPSVDIDHIVAAELYVGLHDGDVSFFFDPENLRGACHEDHARKTSLERRGMWREKASSA
jgi:5-methylcytosine-specific restriction endonuclease McrA